MIIVIIGGIPAQTGLGPCKPPVDPGLRGLPHPLFYANIQYVQMPHCGCRAPNSANISKCTNKVEGMSCMLGTLDTIVAPVLIQMINGVLAEGHIIRAL